MSNSLVTQGPRHASSAVSLPLGPLPDAAELAGDGGVPPWFDLLVVLIIASVLSFGSIGVLLAFFGHYRAALVFPLGGVSTVALVLLGRKKLRGHPRTPLSVLLPAVGMIVIALTSIAGNGILDGHYVQVDRDPGVYAVTAEWIAQHGSLEVNAGDPWLGLLAGMHYTSIPIDYTSAGIYPEGRGRLEFQFAHFMPALMAEGHDVGGDSVMFAVPAVIGGLALLVIYAVGCRLLRRPWLALVAVTALAISLPQLLVSRDSYSETATQLLLWGAVLASLRAWERRSPRLALFAGLVLGAMITSRVDALVYLILLPFMLALAWLAAAGAQRRAVGMQLPEAGAQRRAVGIGIAAFVLGCLPGSALGSFDVQNRAGGYYAALKTQVDQLRLALFAIVVGSLLLAFAWPTLQRLPVWGWLRRRTAVPLAALVVIGLMLAWVVRPHLLHPRGSFSPGIPPLQQAAGLTVDGRRTYAEQSMNWLSSYLGAPVIALALVGAGVLVWAGVRRANPAALLTLTLAGVGTALYLWSPSIAPDQAWASRRYVPAGLPLLVLSAAIGVESFQSLIRATLIQPGRSLRTRVAARSAVRLVAVLGAAVLVIFPLLTTAKVWRFQTQANFITVIKHTCSTLGANAAVLFTSADQSGRTLNQTIHSFCNVPATSGSATVTAAEVAQLSTLSRARGRTLWVLSFSPEAAQALMPSSTGVRLIASADSGKNLGVALNRAPSTYIDRVLAIYGAAVPA